MNILFKGLQPGNVIHALIKGDKLKYVTGSIVGVSQPRIDIPTPQANGSIGSSTMYKEVVDVTFSIDSANYTEKVATTDDCFATKVNGQVTLVATTTEPIVRELHSSDKIAEDYLKQAETEVPKAKQRRKDCQSLIAELDVNYKAQQDNEERFARIEEQQKAIDSKLDRLLEQFENKTKTRG